MILRLAYPAAYPMPNGRWAVALVDRRGRSRTAFINPRKIRAVYKSASATRPFGAYYIDYDSTHQYYRAFETSLPADASKVPLSKIETRLGDIVHVGNGRFKVYLRELERWDSMTFDFATALSILYTGIHPAYGVMD